MTSVDELEPIKKQRIGPILWRERWIIVASIVVMVALAVVYTLRTAKVYEANAILEVSLATSTPGSSDTTSANQALAQNYATLLVSSGFLQEIRKKVDGGNLSVDELASRLSASAQQNSALVTLTATGPSPRSAQTTAQQVVDGFLQNLRSTASARTAQLQNQLQSQITKVSQQISALEAQPKSATVTGQINSLKASQAALIDQEATLIANGVAQGTSAALSAAPEASSTPVSPRPTLNVLAGLVLGALLGVALAWGRYALRPAIHSGDEVTALADLPLLASIPLKSRLKSDDPALAEAYGVLHANLTFMLRASDIRVVTIVGFNPQVGKTSVVEGLGRAASRGERRVLLVDGDMRAATLSARFGYRDHPGLVDVLQGAISLEAGLVSIEPNLSLLPTRPSRVNAASLLAGSRTHELAAELRERFDLVLFDSPPLSGLADGVILASQSDSVLLVVRTGVTKPADLAAVTSSLLHNMTPIAGVVVFEELPDEPYYAAPDAKSQARSAEPVR